jgi:CheY-like chemotaxis protein
MTPKLGGYILVIEDDPGVRDGITNVIENEGYPVIGCEDAQEALDRLMRTSDLPRMIMLDFMMPRMDGWTFLHEREKDQRLRDIPVLGMSASQLLVERAETPAGVEEFLRKPFKVEAMLRSIEKHWNPPPGVPSPRP